MCGIFGAFDPNKLSPRVFSTLAKSAEQRGLDSSGLLYFDKSDYRCLKADFRVTELKKTLRRTPITFVMGHSRLVTNGMLDNQPLLGHELAVLHNGIVLDEEASWLRLGLSRKLTIDTELILALSEKYLELNGTLRGLSTYLFKELKGAMSCAVLAPRLGELLLLSNTGSLYFGDLKAGYAFASEKAQLDSVGCSNISQLLPGTEFCLTVPIGSIPRETNIRVARPNLVPFIHMKSGEEQLLEYRPPQLARCVKCILPETMPFIEFDQAGICNYCRNYKSKLVTKPIEELENLVAPFRRAGGAEVVVPFSGGRDSSFALHLIARILKMRAVTYTYDWGMVTDLGRRNISLMTSQLGVENIVVAADIAKKRLNIRKNLLAWMKSPHLGMLSILTAGDKHFFRHVDRVKNQVGTSLNIWGVNPLETTHFKAGFLGVAPDFAQQRVYNTGLTKQLDYHSRRLGLMLRSPSYFNSSLIDTLSGEYYRSFSTKSDYHHIFDYWQWDEEEIEATLLGEYDWETASDTSTTWRIGDGTAGFYNYAYFTIAGFSEHDTFRSNQIREGKISRDKALELVDFENRPRYQNIKWYLTTLGLDFDPVIQVVNSAKKAWDR